MPPFLLPVPSPRFLSMFLLEVLPEIIGIKEPRKLSIDIHYMHVPFPIIPHHHPAELPVLTVPLNLDAQAPIHLQPQQHLILHAPSPRPALPVVAPALHPLHLELLQARVELGQLGLQALRLHLEVGRGLGDAELLRVEPRDLGRVLRRRVRRRQLRVLRRQRVERPREPPQRPLGLAQPQLPRLLQRGQRFRDARDRRLVGRDVEVCDGVADELGPGEISC
ncbi:hypothetical protein VTK26DRAFT_4725 [Humicola hyalothermophila]